MAPGSRRRLAPRRRRDDEDESSLVGDVEDDSMSDGSALSLGDEEAEASDASDEHEAHGDNMRKPNESKPALAKQDQPADPKTADAAGPFPSTADTAAMMNGLKLSSASNIEPELHFDDAAPHDGKGDTDATQPPTEAPRAPRRETVAQQAKREHQEYLKQRDSDPAFVPNRGGFFLHDDRSPNVATVHNKPFGRGRGRGFNGVVPAGRGVPFHEPMDKQWSHDLHERHESNMSPVVKQGSGELTQAMKSTAPPPSVAPNREFSFSTVLGNVTVNVCLPGMAERRAVPGLVKKQHTLLPTHRPPLRRDKPVRISIPNVESSYRFPSTDRSFIFIPRALRPNQQPYMRGRGRGSFQASRRPSVMGSVYTPSVAMSRKSSFGGVGRDSVRSPAGSNYGRPVGMEPVRPIVRFPAQNMMPMPMSMPMPMPMPMSMPMPMQMPAGPMPVGEIPTFHPPHANGSMSHGVHSTAIPMHQPRPQKAVSLTNIESPASLSIKAPQQQQEQPFHQQVPPHMGAAEEARGQQVGQTSAPAGTPLSHIPEGAIYAQPFQPYPMAPGPMYYPAPYGNAGMFYPPVTESMQGYGHGWADGTYQNMNPGQGGAQPVQPPAPASGPTMHMQNGMVYYTDPSMGQPGALPMTGGYGFYPMVPNPMFYPAQP